MPLGGQPDPSGGSKRVIRAPHLPPAVGPYSAGVVAGGFVFVAQGPISPMGEVVGSTVAEQARQTLHNIELVLREAGCSRHDVVKVTVYLADIEQYPALNGVYASFFERDFPSRIVIQAARLPLGLLVEMEAVAVLPGAG
ncbi:MAG TPA: Rid family detoxifying hydrolase [Actinomycetota bacterium]|nr:Rid family detoxifying hydrolase [Actinomycetota bacterium]